MESVSPKWYRPRSWHAPPTQASVRRTETVLEFSRQTVAARAIVSMLREFDIPEGEPLQFAERPREEPAFLTAVPTSPLRRWFHRKRLRRFRSRWS
jgi:hypothetical protein